MNIGNFLIGYCQLDDADDNDDLLLEIFSYLNEEANKNDYPDKTLWLLFFVYKTLVPIADNLGRRFKNVNFSITEMFKDMNNIDAYIKALLNASEGGKSFFERLIELLVNFFRRIGEFFTRLFGR